MSQNIFVEGYGTLYCLENNCYRGYGTFLKLGVREEVKRRIWSGRSVLWCASQWTLAFDNFHPLRAVQIRAWQSRRSAGKIQEIFCTVSAPPWLCVFSFRTVIFYLKPTHENHENPLKIRQISESGEISEFHDLFRVLAGQSKFLRPCSLKTCKSDVFFTLIVMSFREEICVKPQRLNQT